MNHLLHLLASGMQTGQPLESNPLAHQLFQLTSSGNNPDGLSLMTMNAANPMRISSERLDAAILERPRQTQDIRDFRFLSLGVSGIRRYPENESADYGLLFVRGSDLSDRQPVSSVFIGGNGVGKTSLFNAMEFVVRGNIPSMADSAMNTDQFLQHYSADHRGRITINTKDGIFTRDRIINALPCFLCSSADYDEIRRNEDLTEYIYRQIGLLKSYSIIGMLRNAIDFIRAAKEVHKKKCREYPASSNRSNLLRSLKMHSKVEVNGKAEKIVLYTYFREDSDSKNGWLDHAASLYTYLYDTFKADIGRYYQTILEPVFSSLMDMYLDRENGQILQLRLDGLRFLVKISVGVHEMPPNHYLNAFRQMMYSFSLKFALSCCARHIYGVNLPFIADDLFNSADFDHRLQIERYVRLLTDLHHKHNPDMPLQIIFFTQDYIIGESICKGILTTSYGGKVKFSRIYSVEEAGPENRIRTSEDSDKELILIEDSLIK